MKKLSKLWLDLFFCFILIFLTGHTPSNLTQNHAFFPQDLLPTFVKLGENN